MTVADLLARTDSRELTEWQVYYTQRHDEELYFHEHPRESYDQYLEARERREEHARRAGQHDGLADDIEDDDDDQDDQDEELDG